MIRGLKGIHPIVHPEAFVSEAAYVIGDVQIGANSSIWPGTVIRGDSGRILIGDNTCIQDNSTVHSDDGTIIGNGVVIGHNVLCHADSVGDNVLIGSGATVNGGVHIGGNSIVASGAVVLEGVKIPEGSLVVGVPGKVLTSITAKQTAMIGEMSRHYVERIQDYKAEGDLE